MLCPFTYLTCRSRLTIINEAKQKHDSLQSSVKSLNTFLNTVPTSTVYSSDTFTEITNKSYAQQVASFVIATSQTIPRQRCANTLRISHYSGLSKKSGISPQTWSRSQSSPENCRRSLRYVQVQADTCGHGRVTFS